MSSLQPNYTDKLVSVEKAVKVVKSGNNVVLSNLCSEPTLLPTALMERAGELSDVRLFHCLPMGRFVERYLESGMEAHVRCATPFVGGVPQIVRLLKDGRGDFYPIPLSRLPWLFRYGPFTPDIFMATVSPPDGNGDCNLGVSVDYARAALESARLKIAEVNPTMPRTLGDTKVHLSQFDLIVEAKDPIYEMPSASVTNLEKDIGENVASLVEDGATIQIGFGAVAESIPHFLREKKDLGMHSEMFPESAVPLIESGVLTGEKMLVNKGKVVCAFAAGSRRLYDWLDENSAMALKPFDYTNDIRSIAMNHKMTSINTALQVDLYGSAYSDVLGFDEYSGAGGNRTLSWALFSALKANQSSRCPPEQGTVKFRELLRTHR